MRFAVFSMMASCNLVSVACSQPAIAAKDWTQWGGANRDFQIKADHLPDEVKLSETWRRELGEGYSAILVENGKLHTMYRRGDEEVIVCFDASTGDKIWEYAYLAPMKESAATDFGKGPNSTPIICGNSIAAIGFNGDLHCLDKLSGEVRWKSNLIDEMGGTRVDLGYSQSPIVYDGNLILPIGGQGKGIVALNVSDGSVDWSAQDFDNSYSTPVLSSVDGLDQMIFVMTDEVISVDPNNGKLFWSFPLVNQWSTHAFVPVWDAGTTVLFVSSFRQSHGLQLRREGDRISFKKKWSIERSGIGFANAVIVNGVVYGSTGGSGAPLVTAIELETGKLFWRHGFRTSNYLAIGNRIILLDENGILAIARPNKSALNVIQKQQVLKAPKVWTVPTMVGNRLFMRDQKEIVAYELN